MENRRGSRKRVNEKIRAMKDEQRREKEESRGRERSEWGAKNSERKAGECVPGVAEAGAWERRGWWHSKHEWFSKNRSTSMLIWQGYFSFSSTHARHEREEEKWKGERTEEDMRKRRDEETRIIDNQISAETGKKSSRAMRGMKGT
jgi:hypothetical protein